MSPAAYFAPDPAQIAAFLRSANHQLSGPSMLPPIGTQISIQTLNSGVRHGGQAAACRAVFEGRSAALRLAPAAQRPNSDDPDARRHSLMLDLIGIRQRHPDEMRGVVETYAAFRADVGAVGGGMQATAPMFALVQEYGGISLRDHLRARGPLAPRQAVKLILPVMRALAYLHDRSPSIVHRDIAPDNILRRDDGSLFLIDFGVATVGNRPLDDLTTKFWKDGRMAPEVARANRRMHVSPKLDVWQVGRVLHDMLIGIDEDPFRAGFSSAPNHPKLRTLPAPVRKVLTSMLAPEQHDRPTMRSAYKKLFDWRNPPQATPQATPKKVSSTATPDQRHVEQLEQRLRNRSLALILIVAVLALAGVTAFGLIANKDLEVRLTASGREKFGLDPLPVDVTSPAMRASQVKLPGSSTVAEFAASFDNTKGSDSIGSVTSLPIALRATKYGRVATVSPIGVSTSDTVVQSLSYGCSRTQEGNGIKSTIAPGPYLIVGHLPDRSPKASSWSTDGVWFRGGNTATTVDDVSLLGPACRYPGGAPTGTNWSPVRVTKQNSWKASSGTQIRALTFHVPDVAGRTAGTPYPFQIYGLLWITDRGQFMYGSLPT